MFNTAQPQRCNGYVEAGGHREKAEKLLNAYVDQRGGEDIFDLSSHPFGRDVTDPDIIAAFATGGWDPEDEESLASLSVDDFVSLFKGTRGSERRNLIRGSMGFLNVSNATPRQTQISETARAALLKIGQENPLNACRLRAYGIDLNSPPGA